MIIWISGPTGAGKTSLARLFQTMGYALIEERLSPSTFKAFVNAPARHCATLQKEIMNSRFDAWQRLENRSRVVFDRSIDEDLHVFCQMHFDLGFLTQNQAHDLRNTGHRLSSSLPPPDVIIFLQPAKSVLVNRVTHESHPDFIIKNLDRQTSLYCDWLKSRSDEILIWDNSRCGLRTIQRLLGDTN